MYERFTDRARKCMQLANMVAQDFNHEYVGTEHILLGVLKEGSGVAATVLKNLGVIIEGLQGMVAGCLQRGPDMVTMGKLPHTPRARKVVELAIAVAAERKDKHVGTEHLLLGMIREKEGIAAQCLSECAITEEKFVFELARILKASQPEAASVVRETLAKAIAELDAGKLGEAALLIRNAYIQLLREHFSIPEVVRWASEIQIDLSK